MRSPATMKEDGPVMAVENVPANSVQPAKILRNGMLLIERDGKIYNVQGTLVK